MGQDILKHGFTKKYRLRMEEDKLSSNADTSGLARIAVFKSLKRRHDFMMQDLAVLVRRLVINS